MKLSIEIIAVAIAIQLNVPCFAERGRVTGIIDGDTIAVRIDGVQQRIRLAEIDAPEKGQPYANAAKRMLSDLAYRREADVKIIDHDRYGRIVARVTVDGRDLSIEMVRSGMAWRFAYFSLDPKIAAAEADAKTERRGLWAQRAPVPPWKFRQDNPTAVVGAPPPRAMPDRHATPGARIYGGDAASP